MSVLAHVVHGAQQAEPAATQALTYILKSNPNLTRSIVDLLRSANIEFEPGRIDAELVYGESQPDITIFDERGQLRMFVENKFWAGLTEAQPISYLEKLSADPPSALVFVVPQERVPTVWCELKQRCDDNELEWSQTLNGEKKKYHASVNGKTLMVVSWKTVLTGLWDIASVEGLESAKHDLIQLQGLVNSVNVGAFLPVQAHETNNQEIPNRLINYIDLIKPIVKKLCDDDIADIKGLAFAAAAKCVGHFLTLHGHKQFPGWLGIHHERWSDKGISPFWCRISGNGLNVTHFEKVPELFQVVFMQGENLWLPIRLKTGVERDEVIEDVAQQINRIVEEVLKTISD